MSAEPRPDPTLCVPRHVAIIMDGNGRWAAQRALPRPMGHHRGVKTVKHTIQNCVRRGIQVLTLFAFSSENWRRPREEVSMLMARFLEALDREVEELHENGVRLLFIGNLAELSTALRARMEQASALTAQNSSMTLVVAMAYGGRWDLAMAAREIARRCLAGELQPDAIDERTLGACMSLADLPDPDLLIRTGGEQRISNFLLWNLAYTELYFSNVLWPDFDDSELHAALEHYGQRQRRFGLAPHQVERR
jgi:undecaprenyl diphosphate synthase